MIPTDMNAHHITRRRFLGTTAGTVLARMFGNQTVHASILTRSEHIQWLNGCVLPTHTSPSFVSASSNVLSALESRQSFFGNQKITFSLKSNTSSTLESFLLRQQEEGHITLGLRVFDGLGMYIYSVNGQNENPSNSTYWKIEINGITTSGISSQTVNSGDVVTFILCSTIHSDGIFTDSLGDYSKIIATETLPMWDGKILTQYDWPRDDKGSHWHDFFEITAPANLTFIPDDVSCTKKVLARDPGGNKWKLLTTVSCGTTSNGFIGRSWNSSQCSPFDQPATSMILGNCGIGFPPISGTGSETARINSRINQLRVDKIAVSTQVKVVFAGQDRSSFETIFDWITLGNTKVFTGCFQPLHIKTTAEVIMKIPADQPIGTIEIQTSSDGKNWRTYMFTDNREESFLLPDHDRFARVAIR